MCVRPRANRILFLRFIARRSILGQSSIHWLYTGLVIRRILAISLLALVALAGCRSGQNAATQASDNQNFKAYKLRGKVVSTDSTKGEVTLNHEAIPGFMDAMTMPYKLKDASILGELHPGDVITADVLVSPDPNADYLLDHIVVVAQARADYRPAVSYHVPAPGRYGAGFQDAQSGRAGDSPGAVQG